MPNDRDLLVGIAAVQAGLITADQFRAVFQSTMGAGEGSLPQLLCEKGWLADHDLSHLEYLVDRKPSLLGGDVRFSIISAADEARKVIATLNESVDQMTLMHGSESEATDDTSFTLSPERPQGRYRLNSLHATGGIGEIWLAHDADLQREVAVKRLRSTIAASETARLRFLREARITGRLDHPGVVPIYELCFEESTDQPYYAMRFLRGRTLTETVKEYHRRRTAGENVSQELLFLLNAFITICNTAAYAHAKGVVHRDLKCENVIIGDYGEVIVIDWGLAKELGGDDGATTEDRQVHDDPLSTLAGHVLGSPAYMAPEQAAGRLDLIGPGTDVYGLCAILYEILTGRPPFIGKNTVEVLYHVQHEVPARPSEVVPGVAEGLEKICLQGLSKSPVDRQTSAERLAADVRRWLSELAERKQAEEEREKFFELSTDLLAIVDHEGRLRQVSPVWDRLLAYERTQLIGSRFIERLHPDDRSAARQQLDLSAANRCVQGLENRVAHTDGTYRWISWNLTPIATERSVYIVGRDITELKQSQQLFEGILQSAPDALVIINAAGRIVMTNRQTENVFGYGAEEMIGQPVEILIPIAVRDRHPRHVAEFFSQSAVRPMGAEMHLKGLRKDGREFGVDVALSPIRTEQGMLVAASVRAVNTPL